MAEPVNQPQQRQVEMTLTLLTIPFLVGLVGARSLQESLISIGEASEEVFRGDRLPMLHLQQQNEVEIK